MKKIGCVFLMILFLAMNLGIANALAATNHNSVPMSSQEMLDTVGGEILSCGFAGDFVCCCLNLWIIEICACAINPLAYL